MRAERRVGARVRVSLIPILYWLLYRRCVYVGGVFERRGREFKGRNTGVVFL